MSFPADYIERVYAGVLGKMIGVYLGRPFEGWSYERIMAELGEITQYVHEKRHVPLIVTDDDLSGTFTFLRALPDYGNTRDLTPAQIGQTWLNYIIENRTILWWGGLGTSTEHTAYLRLKKGIPAPESGSIDRNSRVVAEQIGAQIFIDGWAMVAPGDPELAAELARRAARVSHDGEAVYGAQVLAAMEAQAFVEPRLDALLDIGVSYIPRDSLIARLHADIREWRQQDNDWQRTRERIVATYGYDRYGGGCHMVPNHALIVLALVYSDDDFGRALMIVNTSGWDTDCNSGNVGCLMGIKNRLRGIDASSIDWRGPVADRLYLPTADGGRAITDAVLETYHIVNAARGLAGEAPLLPKDGARFHFELPGAVQGFTAEDTRGLTLENVEGQSARGSRSLALRYQLDEGGTARAATATFIPPEAAGMPGYALMASPTLYPGQTIRAGVRADDANPAPVTCRVYIQSYDQADQLHVTHGSPETLAPGQYTELEWRVPDLHGAPIAFVGVELTTTHTATGAVYLDYLGWNGAPDVVFARPGTGGKTWSQAWVNGVDQWEQSATDRYRLVQNDGTGLLIQGTREWTDYTVSADVTPHMVLAAGIAARVQGMRRYYALLLEQGGVARLVKALDGQHTLAEQQFDWQLDQTYTLRLDVRGRQVQGWVNGQQLFDITDTERPLESGGVALVCVEGRTLMDNVRVQP